MFVVPKPIKTFLSSHSSILLIQALVFWPVWQWYVATLSDPAEDAAVLVALVTAGIFFLWKKPARKQTQIPFHIPILLLLLYIISFHLFSPMLRAVIAVITLSYTLNSWRFGSRLQLWLYGLLLLALPVLSPMYLYLGYPLRLLVGKLSVLLLRLFGAPVILIDGIAFHWAGTYIWSDELCSGVRKLWAGLYLACSLAAFYNLRARTTLVVTGWAVSAFILANTLRTAFLVYVYGGMTDIPWWLHKWEGPLMFLLAALATVWFVQKVKKPRHVPEDQKESNGRRPVSRRGIGHHFGHEVKSPLTPLWKRGGLLPAFRRPVPPFSKGGLGGILSTLMTQIAGRMTNASRRTIGTFLLFCLIAAIVPFWPIRSAPNGSLANFPGWPDQFNGFPLHQLDLSQREQPFIRGFPGKIARFTDGEREFIIRWIARPSKVLSAWDCFKRTDYTRDFGPIWRDSQGYPWRTFEASTSNETLQVLERIYDEAGQSWTDISSWYWAALLRKTSGPWWIVTIIVAEASPNG